jgi:mycoredoxin
VSSTDPSHSPADGPATTVEFYWRAGCGFCAALERQLDRLGVQLDKRDIWADERAAAFVRSVADGNEVVPTIRVANQSLVNPSAPAVVALIQAQAPHLMPAED